MIARITYRLPHIEGVIHSSDWVTPADGYDQHRAIESFQRSNPSAIVESFDDVTEEYRIKSRKEVFQ